VGPGSVLRDIMESGVVPVVDLRKIFRQVWHSWTKLAAAVAGDLSSPRGFRSGQCVRDHVSCFAQAEASTIVTTAHQINAGIMPTMQPITTEQLPVRCHLLYRSPIHCRENYVYQHLCCTWQQALRCMLLGYPTWFYSGSPSQDVVAEPGSAHWVQVDDRSGADAVEAAAIDAVKQLQASGMNIAKDLQVSTVVRLSQQSALDAPTTPLAEFAGSKTGKVQLPHNTHSYLRKIWCCTERVRL
jgi:hypothetical protein